MSSVKYYVGNSKLIDSFYKKNPKPPTLIITSPPYYNVLNYNNHKDQIGRGQSYNEYLEDVADIFQKCYNISQDHASLWIVIDTFRKDGEVKLLPFDIVNKLKEKFEKTWLLKDVVIWDKQKNLPWNGNGNFKNQFEYVLFLTKNAKFQFNIDEVREVNDLKKWWKKYPERYNPDGKAPSNLWSFPNPLRGWGDGKQNHLCPFPFELAEKIISISTSHGDVVFDPFAGSGTALAIAEQMGRAAWGIDINKQYKDLFKKEVLIGAKEYWKKRSHELELNKDYITEFASTNLKLRKLKTANILLKYINREQKKEHFLVVLDDGGNSNKILLTISPSFDGFDKLNTNSDILNFLRQSKIKFEIVPNNILLNKEWENVIFYKYGIDRFFAYTTTCRIRNVLKLDNKEIFFYSNIKMKIAGNQ